MSTDSTTWNSTGPSLRIVTHCYSVALKQYASLLRYQLSSLVLHKPTCSTHITICFSIFDHGVFAIAKEFQPLLAEQGVSMQMLGMRDCELFRRCIGRNMVAMNQQQDVVWFCDADHVFGPGCVDHVCRVWYENKGEAKLFYPKTISIHKTHEIGDEYVQRAIPGVNEIDTNDFEPKAYNRAIGGVQIVDGDWCRDHGYLNKDRRYQKPVDGTKPFPDFRDDIRFRKIVKREGECSFDLPELYRLRHTKTTYQ